MASRGVGWAVGTPQTVAPARPGARSVQGTDGWVPGMGHLQHLTHRPLRARAGLLLGAGAAALLATASPASAGAPNVIGNVTKGRPTVTAGGAPGVFHVAFQDEGSRLVVYCQVTSATSVPGGGVGCAKKALLPFSGPSGEAVPEVPWVLRDPASGTLHVVMQNYLVDAPDNTNHTWVWTSTDDGTTFTGPTAIHQRGVGTDPSRPFLSTVPGRVNFASWNTELFSFSAAIDGSGGSTESSSRLDTGGLAPFNFGGGTRIAPWGAHTLAVSDTGEQVYAWEAGPGADLGNQAVWSAPTIVDAGSGATISGGGDEAYLAYTRKSDDRLVARTYAGTEWGDAVVVNPDEPVVETAMHDQNISPGGKIVVGYREGGSRLRVSQSDNGVGWETKTIAVSDELFSDLSVARDDAGNGLAVWTRSGAIVAATMTSVRDKSAPRRTVSVSKDGFTTGLGVDGSCLLPGNKATLTVGGQGKGKVTKVAFSLGKQKVSDAAKPYLAAFTVPKKAEAGASLPAKATITHVFKKKGKTVSKQRTITTDVEVCGG